MHSLCPSIFGHELVKAGLLLALLGGVRKAPGGEGEMALRGDVHVMMVGDPGLGKSQLLQVIWAEVPPAGSAGIAASLCYCNGCSWSAMQLCCDAGWRGCTFQQMLCTQRILPHLLPLQAAAAAAPRGVYICGNTSSAAGLTVSVTRENGEFAFDAGALVLADRGVCCIGGRVGQLLAAVCCLASAAICWLRQVQVSSQPSCCVLVLLHLSPPCSTCIFPLPRPPTRTHLPRPLYCLTLCIASPLYCSPADEFDKMGSDHQSLLGAMEQQEVSVAKAGMVACLPARTTVLAAANPVEGSYNKGRTLLVSWRSVGGAQHSALRQVVACRKHVVGWRRLLHCLAHSSLLIGCCRCPHYLPALLCRRI